MWGKRLIVSSLSKGRTHHGLSHLGLTLIVMVLAVGMSVTPNLGYAKGDAGGHAVGSAAAGFSSEEMELLWAGKSVKRKFHLDVDDVRYRAGLSYRLVRGAPLDVVRVLRSPQGIAKAIPYGIEATTFEERNGVSKIRIRQGKPPIVGGYTVRMKWEMNHYRARFWLDPNHEHDVRDIWGWFMAREVEDGVTLICFAVAFDLGGVGEILGSKAHRWSLNTADRIGKLVEERTGQSFNPDQSPKHGDE